MPTKLIRRFLVYYIVFILVLYGVLHFFLHKENRRQQINLFTNRAKEITEILRVHLKPLVIQQNKTRLNAEIREIAERLNLRLAIIDANGQIIASSESIHAILPQKVFTPEFVQAVKFGEGRAIRKDANQKITWLYYVLSMQENDKNWGFVRIGMRLDRIPFKIPNIIWGLFTICILFGATVIFLYLTFPIRKIIDSLHKMAAGEVLTRSLTRRKDELGIINELINELNERMHDLIRSASAEKEELRLLISTISIGLIVLDERGKIVASNDSFRKIIGDVDIIERYYWEIINAPQFEWFIKELKNKSLFTQEFTHNDRIYLLTGNVIQRHPEKYIIAFNDITDIKKLSEMKSELIINVSHELKTPLTSLKGSIETLKEKATKYQMPFIKIMERNINRMIKIVEDLLLSALLEHQVQVDEQLEIRQINLTSLLRELRGLFKDKLKEKKLKLKINIAREARIIYGDLFLIEEMFMNLIDNAIKYNVENGQIVVEITQENNTITIVVEDTGIGIPKEHLLRIFERFYVVDKARSRTLGGTGLGLAIVKQIVLRHQGEISVTSEVGKGTRFVIKLPQLKQL